MWRYLKYFLVVAQEQHFRKAAETLYITQSALSKAMDNLEKELGFPLFEKQGRNAKLTRYGEIMYEHVRSAAKEIEDGLQYVQMLTDTYGGPLRIDSIYTMGTDYIPALIKEFTKEYSNIEIYYSQKSTNSILMDLLEDKVDIGFCGEYDVSDPAYSALERETVLIEELFLFVPEDHPFSQKTEISCREFLDEDLIGWNASSGIAMSIDKELKKEGLHHELKHHFFATEDNTVAEMVRQGLGLALMTDSRSINTTGLHKIKLRNPALKRRLYMVWKKTDFCPLSAKAFKCFALSQKWSRPE